MPEQEESRASVSSMTCQFGVKLITGETIWDPQAMTIENIGDIGAAGKVAERLMALAGASQGTQAVTHHLMLGEEGVFFIPADKVLYHVVRKISAK